MRKKKRAVINILQREKCMKANNTRKKKERPRRGEEAATNFTTTALTLDQPHSLVPSPTALCGFQAPLNRQQGQP